MRVFAIILALAAASAANPLLFKESEQRPLGFQQQTHPGFDLDLNERRLIQLEGQEPVWITELEKARSYRTYVVSSAV